MSVLIAKKMYHFQSISAFLEQFVMVVDMDVYCLAVCLDDIRLMKLVNA